MYSLKPQTKKQEKGQTHKNNKSNANKKKQQSKKITKTLFEDPFYYKIQLIPVEQSYELETLLKKYIDTIRQRLPPKPARVGRQAIIKFKESKQIQKKKAPIVCKQLIIGVKSVRNHIIKRDCPASDSPKMVIVFYQEKKHDYLEQFLCLLKFTVTPFILTRENQQINRCLGVRTVGALGLTQDKFSNDLLKYIGMSQVEIPWLIDLGGQIANKV